MKSESVSIVKSSSFRFMEAGDLTPKKNVGIVVVVLKRHSFAGLSGSFLDVRWPGWVQIRAAGTIVIT